MGYGGETWIRDFVKGFPGDNTFTVVTTSNGARNVRFKEMLSGRKVKIVEMENRVRHLPVFIPKRVRRFADIVRQSDIVYIMGLPLMLKFFTLILKKIYGVHIIRGFHSPVHGDRKEPARLARRILYFWLLERMHLFIDRRFDVIHVLNGESQEIFHRYGKSETYIIPNGIDVCRYKAMDKYENFTVLFIGRLNYQKGADLLRNLVYSLEERGVTFRLMIVGKRDLYGDDIIRLSSTQSNVDYLGFVEDEKKMELMAKSHVLISPTRYEGFPLTDLEAMASGTPVVSFNVPGPSDFINNGANSFIAENIEDMAEKIAEINSRINEGSYDILCRNARLTAERYDWKDVFPEFDELFRKILDGETRAKSAPALKILFRRD